MDPALYEPAGYRLVGALFNYGLYGVFCVQTYIYLINFPNDKTFIRLLVYGIFILDTAQTVLITFDTFNVFVYGFGDPGKIDDETLMWFDLCIVNGLGGSPSTFLFCSI
ncbi:hypothetical protein V5O48_015994 [Marasmius crinis-equi]|uniref:Uncharacterized protein n=1 Tax=Marasmius crinis-equi TaxID=585013 RepID=A0ABR3ET13_9AGAR